MKNRFLLILFVIILTTMIVFAPLGCSSKTPDILNVDNEGNTTIDNESLDSWLDEQKTAELSSSEEAGILYMREEEKLARDVYLQLYLKWNIQTFRNIGESEQTHTDAMKSLINLYGLQDPSQNKEIGEFTNPILQQLYDDLVELGNKSEIDALKVGAAIEEIDILDIEEYMSQTDNEDILLVYENLLQGSRNHLRSFVSVMEKRGVSYEPQYLTSEQFNDIIGAPIER